MAKAVPTVARPSRPMSRLEKSMTRAPRLVLTLLAMRPVTGSKIGAIQTERAETAEWGSVGEIPSKIGEGLEQAFLMAYEVWWALVLGFAISAIVQAWVPRERIEGALSGSGPRPLAWATGLGAASSSCSYAAIAIAKSLFQKGASAASALTFQFASTNLVWELGLVLWVLIGWQFTLAEYLGGVIMIVLMAIGLRAFVSPALEEQRPPPRPAGRRRPPAPRRRRGEPRLARAPDLVLGLVGRGGQLPRRLADALEGDRDRLPARRLHRAARQRLLQQPLRQGRARPSWSRSRTCSSAR